MATGTMSCARDEVGNLNSIKILTAARRSEQGSVHGEHRIEEVREADAVRFGDEPVRGAVAVEAPRAPLLHDFEARFVVAVEDLLGDPAGGRR